MERHYEEVTGAVIGTRAEHVGRRTAAIIVLSAMVLAACGGEASVEDSTTTSSATSTTASGPATTVADATTTTVADAWAEVEAAAREEGELVLYTVTHDVINRNELEAFTALYPEIAVSVVRLASEALTNRFAAEKEAGAASADVIKLAAPTVILDQPDWFIPMSEELVPNLSVVGEVYRGDHFFRLLGGRYVLTYNTDLVSDPISDICRIGETPDDLHGLVQFSRPGGGSQGWGSYAIVRDACGDEALEAIGEMIASGKAVHFQDNATAIQEVAAGAAAVVYWGQPSHSADVRDAGAPVAYEPVSNPSWALAHHISLVEGAENPNAARVFANFLLTVEGMAASCSGEYWAILPDVPDCPLMPEGTQFVDVVEGLAQADEIDALLGFAR